MLIIDKSPTFESTVKVHTAAIKGEFKAKFVALPTDELAALDNGDASGWKALLGKVVKGFDQVQIDGEAVSGDQPGGLDKLIRWPGVGAAMVAAYYKGLWEASQGN